MGASYYAYAVIGVEVTGKLHTISQRPSCEHQPTGAFCASCGKPNRPVEVKTPIAGYDEDRGTLGAFRVVHTTDNAKAFVGISVESGNLNYPDKNSARLAVSEDEIAARLNDLRWKLTDLGLWDEASFGLWVVGNCSY